ncbi:MAG: hypothetical protein GX287_04245 [Fusobacteria bacterium]|nr:hypothetical protein [Fusobacteriota bacterium]
MYVAYKDGYEPSEIVEKTYKIQVSEPSTDTKAGTYEKFVDVVLTGKNSDAKIYYTLDGEEPTDKSGIEYQRNQIIKITETSTLKFRAYKDGCEPSEIVEIKYEIVDKKVSSVIPSKKSDIYKGTQNIELSVDTTGATIYYTLDGTIPTEESNRYNTSIEISKTTTLSAIALFEGYAPSNIIVERYLIQSETPSVLPISKKYKESVEVTLSGTTGTSIRYTLDETDPTETSELYIDNFTIYKNTILKAISFRDGCEPSEIVERVYKIQVSEPSANNKSGEYVESVEIILTGTTGSSIRYTLDGEDPTDKSGIEYKTDDIITITTTSALRFIAYKDDCEPSNIITEEYTIIDKKVSSIISNKKSGTYTDSQYIELSVNETGAVIYYTLDGTTPTEASNRYKQSIEISKNTTLKAKAFLEGYTPSDVLTLNYNIRPISPTMSKSSGEYDYNFKSKIESKTYEGIEIYYTTDGSDPTKSSIKYSDEYININKTTTIKARSYVDGMEPSEIMEIKYILKVKKPILSSEGETFTDDSLTLWINGNDNWNESRKWSMITYYTTDESDPVSTGNYMDYSSGAAIVIKENTVVKVRTFYEDPTGADLVLEPSDIITAVFTRKLNTPTINPGEGYQKLYQSYMSYSLHGSSDVEIRYTLNGDEPTRNSTLFTSDKPIELTRTTTIKARAFKDNCESSDILDFPVEFIVGDLKLTKAEVADGKYSVSLEPTITTGATIYYTLDGTEVTKSSTKYTHGTSIPITAPATLRAKGYKDGFTDSKELVEIFFKD